MILFTLLFSNHFTHLLQIRNVFILNVEEVVVIVVGVVIVL